MLPATLHGRFVGVALAFVDLRWERSAPNPPFEDRDGEAVIQSILLDVNIVEKKLSTGGFLDELAIFGHDDFNPKEEMGRSAPSPAGPW